MLAKRIIPAWTSPAAGSSRASTSSSCATPGDPVEIAARYNEQGADELTFLDITATSDGRDLILPHHRGRGLAGVHPADGRRRRAHGRRRAAAAQCRRRQDQLQLGRHRQPRRDQRASAKYGAQCIVVAIDAKRRSAETNACGRARPGLGRLQPRRAQEHRPGRRGLGHRDGAARRRRDPAHQHGPRRHQVRLRPGADPRGERRGPCR
jgi:cyclase